MDSASGIIDDQLKSCRSRLGQLDIELNKMLDEILVCSSRSDVDNALARSRKLFAEAREHLQEMQVISMRLYKPRDIETVSTEASERKKQFDDLNSELRNAVAQRLSYLDKAQRSELLTIPAHKEKTDISAQVGVRKVVTQDDAVKTSAVTTEKLSRVARALAQEIAQSEETIRTLVTSSDTLSRATDEFQVMGSTIQQGANLIGKYDRRQFLDKVIITLAIIFFFAVCGYIVNKRLFGGFNWISFFIGLLFPASDPEVPPLSVREL